MSLFNFTNHHLINSSDEVVAICRPLANFFNTTYLNFVRRYEDTSEACLTTDPDWTMYFYQQKLYKLVLADKFAQTKSLLNRLKIIPWSQFSQSPVRIAQSELFDVGIGLTLIFTKRSYVDFFHFGTKNENTYMSEFYINYADCLVQFAHYFYDVASKLISVASLEENRFYVPDRPFKKEVLFHKSENLDIETFLQCTQPKRFYIENEIEPILLTKKEIMCINLLTQGKSASEIGDSLFMSKRTVETHLKNSRTKLGLKSGSSKSDLLSELFKKGFDFNHLILNNIE
jgi:DNA-binding CsgD family transcriptional regulator